MKTKLRNYPGAKKVCEYVEYYNQHPHELCRCDGSLALYGWCRWILQLDHYIFQYGECTAGDIYNYDYAHALIRRVTRQINLRKRR